MANTQLPISEYLKQGVFILIIISVALFGIKGCRKYQKKRAVIIQLTSQTSESSSYEQFYTTDAKATLLKTMYQMHLATELGMTPEETLKEVMEESEALLDTDNDRELPIRKAIIRDTLLSNFDNCKKLGIFADQSNLFALEKGEIPIIKIGPSANEDVVISTIIPSSVLDGVDKLIPNLVVSPPTENANNVANMKLNEFEIARAKQFAKALEDAELITQEAYKKIFDYYESKAKISIAP
jgi:hypothetical protein